MAIAVAVPLVDRTAVTDMPDATATDDALPPEPIAAAVPAARSTTSLLASMGATECMPGLYCPQIDYAVNREWLIDQMEAIIARIDALVFVPKRSNRLGKLVKHMAVRYLDMLHVKCDIQSCEFHGVLLACVHIAAKVDADDGGISIDTLLGTLPVGVCCTKDDYERFERHILHHLDWDLNVVTAYHCMSFCVDHGITFDADRVNGAPVHPHVMHDLRRDVRVYMEAYLRHYAMQRFAPSMVCATIIAALRYSSRIAPTWPDTLVAMTGYALNDLEACFRQLALALRAHTSKPRIKYVA